MRGGIAHFNSLLCRELAKQHQVRFWSFTRQYPGLLFPGTSQLETGDDPAPIATTASVDSIGPLSWFKTARAIIRERPDALVFRYWMPFFAPCFGTIARQVKRATSAPVLLICDNIVPHEPRPFDVALTRYMLRAADGFVTMSRPVQEDLFRLRPGARAELVPHPVYSHFGQRVPQAQARERLGWDPHRRVLLFFGFIRHYKGLDVLLRAMPEIHRATGARLVVLGEFYEDRAPYDRIVTELGIGSIVQMPGDYAPTEQVTLAFSACDLVVLPYRSATQSGIVQTAFQLDRPVVCTRVGGLEEMVTDGESGLLVPPEDAPALSAAVARYFDEGLEPRLVEGVRRAKAVMGWDTMANAVVRLAISARNADALYARRSE